jgi:hypothetical protein
MGTLCGLVEVARGTNPISADKGAPSHGHEEKKGHVRYERMRLKLCDANIRLHDAK